MRTGPKRFSPPTTSTILRLMDDGDFEFDVDVFPSGTISGTVCFVVPTNEIGVARGLGEGVVQL